MPVGIFSIDRAIMRRPESFRGLIWRSPLARTTVCMHAQQAWPHRVAFLDPPDHDAALGMPLMRCRLITDSA